MPKYPDIEVGDLWTADLAASMLPEHVHKEASTLRPTTTVVADDPDLTVEVEANATYFVEFYIRYATSAVAGFKTAWDVPSGVTSTTRACLGPADSASSTSGDDMLSRYGVYDYATVAGYGDRDSSASPLILIETGVVVTGGTAGNVTFQWAQASSSGINTAVYAGSYARCTRIA